MSSDSLHNLTGPHYPFLLPHTLSNRSDTVRSTHTLSTPVYNGIEPVRQMKDYDSVFLLFAACFLLFSIILLRWKSYVMYGLHTIFRLPKRSPMYIESSQNIARVNHLLMPITIVMFSFFIYIWLNGGLTLTDERHWICTMGCFSLLFACFYWLKFAVFNLLSYVFFSPFQRQIWNESYMSNLIFCGIFCFPVFMFLVYSNIYSPSFILFFLLAFLFIRLVQLQKTFVIFIHEYVSLFYLILYLCTVEIMPAILLVEGLRSVFYLV